LRDGFANAAEAGWKKDCPVEQRKGFSEETRNGYLAEKDGMILTGMEMILTGVDSRVWARKIGAR
jgi:hypothetical protein